jgi:hypothetical protein
MAAIVNDVVVYTSGEYKNKNKNMTASVLSAALSDGR